MFVRYVVLINGKKSIHEALVEKSTDFADRPEVFTCSELDLPAKGSFLTTLSRS